MTNKQLLDIIGIDFLLVRCLLVLYILFGGSSVCILLVDGGKATAAVHSMDDSTQLVDKV